MTLCGCKNVEFAGEITSDQELVKPFLKPVEFTTQQHQSLLNPFAQQEDDSKLDLTPNTAKFNQTVDDVQDQASFLQEAKTEEQHNRVLPDSPEKQPNDTLKIF